MFTVSFADGDGLDQIDVFANDAERATEKAIDKTDWSDERLNTATAQAAPVEHSGQITETSQVLPLPISEVTDRLQTTLASGVFEEVKQQAVENALQEFVLWIDNEVYHTEAVTKAEEIVIKHGNDIMAEHSHEIAEVFVEVFPSLC